MKTFEIDQIVKPDMSDYLIHMTSERSFNSILNSGRHESEGLINALVPQGAKKSSFNHKITCFTETPVHAIGAFIEISKRRSSENMVYGIGFKKAFMVEKGVRPTAYLDNTTLGKLLQVKSSENLSVSSREFIDLLAPLVHPLGEKSQRQGFSWEREWRYVDDTGFRFDYDDIKVICCPSESKSMIKIKLGEYADKIKFFDTSLQYQELTDFLSFSKERDSIEAGIFDSDDRDLIDEFLSGFDLYIEQLAQHKEFLLQLTAQVNAVESELTKLREWQEELKAHTAEYCGHYSKYLINNKTFGTICPDCNDYLKYVWDKQYKDA